jgi:hypothetical protein
MNSQGYAHWRWSQTGRSHNKHCISADKLIFSLHQWELQLRHLTFHFEVFGDFLSRFGLALTIGLTILKVNISHCRLATQIEVD